MMTGDSKTTADAVAKKIGLDGVIAGVLPDQKAAEVKRLQSEKMDRTIKRWIGQSSPPRNAREAGC